MNVDVFSTQIRAFKVRTILLALSMLIVALGLAGCASPIDLLDSFLEPAVTDTPASGIELAEPTAIDAPTTEPEPAAPVATDPPISELESTEDGAVAPEGDTAAVAETVQESPQAPVHVQAVVSAHELATAAGITVLSDQGPALPLIAAGVMVTAVGATLLTRFLRSSRTFLETH